MRWSYTFVAEGGKRGKGVHHHFPTSYVLFCVAASSAGDEGTEMRCTEIQLLLSILFLVMIVNSQCTSVQSLESELDALEPPVGRLLSSFDTV